MSASPKGRNTSPLYVGHRAPHMLPVAWGDQPCPACSVVLLPASLLCLQAQHILRLHTGVVGICKPAFWRCFVLTNRVKQWKQLA